MLATKRWFVLRFFSTHILERSDERIDAPREDMVILKNIIMKKTNEI